MKNQNETYDGEITPHNAFNDCTRKYGISRIKRANRSALDDDII